MVLGEVRREVGHPRGRLGRAVHHDEVPAAAAAEAAPAAYGVGVEAPAGLGHLAQRRQVAVLEAAGRQQVEGVRDPGEGGGAGAGEEVPEALVDHAQAGQHDARAGDEVRVQHREAVAVVQRQRGDRAVRGGQGEVVGDRGGVAGDVGAREPDQLRRPGRPRRAEQQREVGVEVVRGRVAAYVVADAGETDDVGVVGRDDGVALGAARVGDDQRDVAVLEGREVGDERVEVVGALDQDQPPLRSPGAGAVGDQAGECGMAELDVARDDGGRVAERRVGEDRRRADRCRGAAGEAEVVVTATPRVGRRGPARSPAGGRCRPRRGAARRTSATGPTSRRRAAPARRSRGRSS